MDDKQNILNRANILERVTTPLGFFTLGVLVVEAILASLSLRASGLNLTILIVGMLIGFLSLFAMVFWLAMHPQHRASLLGRSDMSPAKSVRDYGLTPNDIRFIVTFRACHYPEEAQHAVLGGKPLPLGERLQKLKSLGLVETSTYKSSERPLEFMLTAEGRELADLIRILSEPMIELRERTAKKPERTF